MQNNSEDYDMSPVDGHYIVEKILKSKNERVNKKSHKTQRKFLM